MDDASRIDTLAAELTAALGPDGVVTEAAERAVYGADIWARGATPVLVIRPDGTDALAQAAAICASHGRALLPRGGGMSYTGGYVTEAEGAVLVDLGRMTRILTIDEDDMYAVVEAGVTWAQLQEALKEKGLRAAWWGTLSGFKATVGGSLSQNSIFFGSGRNHGSPDACIGLRVVTADGRVLPTGTLATRNAEPFWRNYGPDLTGLFLGDTGALAIKAEAVLRLARIPAASGYASFAWDTHSGMCRAMADIAREGLASEVAAFDPQLQQMRMKRANLAEDMKALRGVVAQEKSLVSGLKEAAKVAVAGRGFMDQVEWSAHYITEARDQAGVETALAAMRRIAQREGGREIENTIPKVMHGMPFPPLHAMLGPEGERWLPVHMVVPLSKAADTIDRLQAIFASHQAAVDQHGIEIGMLLSAVGAGGFVLEPVFYWRDELFELHERGAGEDHIAKLPKHPANPAAAAVIKAIRDDMNALSLEIGAVHFQIGRTYPYRQGMDSQSWDLLEAIKTHLDPDRRMNPGSLGLD